MEKAYYIHMNADQPGAARLLPIGEYDSKGLKQGIITLERPLHMRIDQGKKFYDFLWFQDIFNFCVSDHIHALLAENRISGWKSYPIEIEGHPTQKYHGIQVTGRCGPLIRPDEKGFVKGIRFDLDGYDESDMFMIEGTMLTVFSEKLGHLLKRSKASNLQLDEVAQKKWFNT